MSRSILSKLNRRTVLRGIGTGLALADAGIDEDA